MKRLITFFIIILIFSSWFFGWKKTNTDSQIPQNVLSEKDAQISPSPIWPQSILLDLDESPIRVSWTIVEPSNVEAYSNLKNHKLSEEIKVDNSCKILVNGGYYTKENTHLGLFISNSEVLSKMIESATLNGFLTINSKNQLSISSKLPDDPLRIALQTGPLLMVDGKSLNLSLKNDQQERRIVAGSTYYDKLIFLVFYNEQSNLQGPLLEQIPKALDLFKQQTGLRIINAINLDGGSASVFISNYDLLREMTYIGSYFCAK